MFTNQQSRGARYKREQLDLRRVTGAILFNHLIFSNINNQFKFKLVVQSRTPKCYKFFKIDYLPHVIVFITSQYK